MVFESLIEKFCQQHPANTYWLAYSGGVDSHVLLSLFAEIRKLLSINVRAIHIHHGLSKNADAWAQHCENTCNELAIDCTIRKISINTNNGESLEEAARRERYAIFAEYIQAGDILLTAHHQDDQAETFMLQLLRGAGVKGLSAMPMIKPFAQGLHARPLLSLSRLELLQYAQQRQLAWIEDESNDNKKFMRNFIRREVMPLIMQREPKASEIISRSASHCSEAQHLLDEYAVIDMKQCAGSRADTLSVEKLNALSPARQRLTLRYWIHSLGFRLPDHRRLESILRDVLTADWDRVPCVVWVGVEVRRYGDDLFVMKAFTSVPELPAPLHIPDKGTITFKFRKGGEVLPIPGRGSQSLKNLFQEWRVPPWLRDRTPLMYIGEQLIGVAGYYLHPDFCGN